MRCYGSLCSKVPAKSRISLMCLADNLPDTADCGGLYVWVTCGRYKRQAKQNYKLFENDLALFLRLPENYMFWWPISTISFSNSPGTRVFAVFTLYLCLVCVRVQCVCACCVYCVYCTICALPTNSINYSLNNVC